MTIIDLVNTHEVTSQALVQETAGFMQHYFGMSTAKYGTGRADLERMLRDIHAHIRAEGESNERDIHAHIRAEGESNEHWSCHFFHAGGLTLDELEHQLDWDEHFCGSYGIANSREWNGVESTWIAHELSAHHRSVDSFTFADFCRRHNLCANLDPNYQHIRPDMTRADELEQKLREDNREILQRMHAEGRQRTATETAYLQSELDAIRFAHQAANNEAHLQRAAAHEAIVERAHEVQMTMNAGWQ